MNAGPHQTGNASAGRHAAGIVLLALALLAPALGTLPLLDRDEPRFAQAAREMLERPDFVVPYFNGDYRFDKPPLIYWMMMPGYALAGVREWTARAPAVACAAALAMLVYLTGRRLFSARTGLVAAVMTVTHLQMMLHGRASVADMPMILAVFASQWALYELIRPDAAAPSARWFWMLYGSLGIGFLAKGPIALLIPGLTLPLFWLLSGRPALGWRRLRAGPGLALVLAIVAAWGVPALLRTHGEFLHVGIGRHVVERGMKPLEGHSAWPIFYFLVAPASLFPWSALLPAGLRTLATRGDPRLRFLLAWVIVTYAIFTPYATKLPHYVFPCFPALFLAFAEAWGRGWPATRLDRAWAAGIAGLAGVLVLGLAGAALYATRSTALGVTPALLGGLAAGIAGLGLAPLALRWGRAAGWVAVVILIAGGMQVAAAEMRAMNPSIAVARLLAGQPSGACAFQGYREPSVVFYTNRRWSAIEEPGALREFAADPGTRALLVKLAETRSAPGKKSKPPTPRDLEIGSLFERLGGEGYTLHRIEGWNFARSSRVTLGLAIRAEQGGGAHAP